MRAIPATDWEVTPPEDELLRKPPRVREIASDTERRTGALYAFDTANDRVIAYEKESGDYVRQYRLAGGNTGWANLRAMYVVEGIENQPGTLWWIDGSSVRTSVLDSISDIQSPSPSCLARPPSPEASPSS